MSTKKVQYTQRDVLGKIEAAISLAIQQKGPNGQFRPKEREQIVAQVVQECRKQHKGPLQFKMRQERTLRNWFTLVAQGKSLVERPRRQVFPPRVEKAFLKVLTRTFPAGCSPRHVMRLAIRVLRRITFTDESVREQKRRMVTKGWWRGFKARNPELVRWQTGNLQSTHRISACDTRKMKQFYRDLIGAYIRCMQPKGMHLDQIGRAQTDAEFSESQVEADVIEELNPTGTGAAPTVITAASACTLENVWQGRKNVIIFNFDETVKSDKKLKDHTNRNARYVGSNEHGVQTVAAINEYKVSLVASIYMKMTVTGGRVLCSYGTAPCAFIIPGSTRSYSKVVEWDQHDLTLAQNTCIFQTPSASLDGDAWSHYLKWFIGKISQNPQLSPGKNTVIFQFDRVSSHLSPAVVSLFVENDIHAVLPPSKTTSVTQPLDQDSFACYGFSFEDEIHDWLSCHEVRGELSGQCPPPTLADIGGPGRYGLLVRSMAKAWFKGQREDIIRKSFCRSGIYWALYAVQTLLNEANLDSTGWEGFLDPQKPLVGAAARTWQWFERQEDIQNIWQTTEKLSKACPKSMYQQVSELIPAAITDPSACLKWNKEKLQYYMGYALDFKACCGNGHTDACQTLYTDLFKGLIAAPALFRHGPPEFGFWYERGFCQCKALTLEKWARLVRTGRRTQQSRLWDVGNGSAAIPTLEENQTAIQEAEHARAQQKADQYAKKTKQLFKDMLKSYHDSPSQCAAPLKTQHEQARQNGTCMFCKATHKQCVTLFKTREKQKRQRQKQKQPDGKRDSESKGEGESENKKTTPEDLIHPIGLHKDCFHCKPLIAKRDLQVAEDKQREAQRKQARKEKENAKKSQRLKQHHEAKCRTNLQRSQCETCEDIRTVVCGRRPRKRRRTSRQTELSDSCSVCRRKVKAGEEGVLCQPCNTWLHTECLRFTVKSDAVAKAWHGRGFHCPLHIE